MKLLDPAETLASLSGHRRQQVWDASALRSTPALLQQATFDEDILQLREARRRREPLQLRPHSY